jgi:hypothetical protein
MPRVSSNSPNEVVRFFSPENGHHGLIIFRNFFGADNAPTLKEFLDHRQRELAKGGFSNFVPGEATVGSRQVATLDFESPPGADHSITYCRHYLFIDGRIGYVLAFGTSKREQMLSVFDRMAKSFVFEQG